MVTIRNIGDAPLSLTGMNLRVGDDLWLSDSGVEILRGGDKLPPGQRALILTHNDVPTDDYVRRQYAHLLRAARADGERVSLKSGALHVIGSDGVVLPIGPTADPEPVGICCADTNQGPGCATPTFCSAMVEFNDCCSPLILDGCCFEESEATFCPSNGCTGVTCDSHCN